MLGNSLASGGKEASLPSWRSVIPQSRAEILVRDGVMFEDEELRLSRVCELASAHGRAPVKRRPTMQSLNSRSLEKLPGFRPDRGAFELTRERM